MRRPSPTAQRRLFGLGALAALGIAAYWFFFSDGLPILWGPSARASAKPRMCRRPPGRRNKWLIRRNHFGGFVQTSRNGSSVLINPTTRLGLARKGAKYRGRSCSSQPS